MDVLYQSQTPWRFELGCFLEDRGLTSSDVTEVVMMVKATPTTADGSAVVTKKLSLGEIAFVGTDAVSVTIATTDYGAGKMLVGGSYYVYLGFSAPGYTSVYLEARLRNHTVTILQDGIRG